MGRRRPPYLRARASGWPSIPGPAATGRYTLYHLASGRGKDSIDVGGVLADFTGVAVHDGLTSYRRYDVTHGLCGAHHLRELAGIAEATGQDWPVNLADLLCEIHKCVELAKANGATELSARRLAGYRRRYRSLITEGQRLNPPPPDRETRATQTRPRRVTATQTR
ncbi:MAG: transposase [Propionibacteriales bacterium]|nr:transposase [Propionibacteriales bacterium]